jgi:hypothetical protein
MTDNEHLIDVDIPGWCERVSRVDPTILRDIFAVAMRLDLIGHLASAELRLIQPLTTRFNRAFYATVDETRQMDPGLDPIRDAVEDEVFLSDLWRWADRLRDEHPDTPPTERADG